MTKICGVDEAGCGAWAGPVVAAAVILKHPLNGLADSKTLNARKRQQLSTLIKQQSYWAIGVMSAQVIDEINILQATLRAMQMAIHFLPIQPSELLVDGLHAPRTSYKTTTIPKGDTKKSCIQAAAIIAKYSRDTLCTLLDEQYPNYHFAQHKGYGTSLHQQALLTYGACAEHRHSYIPIKRMLQRR